MLSKILRLSIAVIFCSFPIYTTISKAALNTPIIQPLLVPAPPNLNLHSYVLMDSHSGKILASKNIDTKAAPASLTKLMTLYIISKALQTGSIRLDDSVTISKKAWKTSGSKMFVRAGTQVPVQQLIEGIVVDSGNDACVAMAEYIAGTEPDFVAMMNNEAKQLGLKNTHYSNCTGLPKTDHYSTAHDLVILTKAIINNFPQYYHWYNQKWFKYNGIKQFNRNRLLWRYHYADGLKTGHTNSAGYCLVGSAIKNGMRLISVIMGAPTDTARVLDSTRLLNYGFRFFESHLIYQANSIIAKPRVWFGTSKTIPISVPTDLCIVIPRGQFQHVKSKITYIPNLKAPIKKYQTVGEITITLYDKIIAKQNLVALTDVLKGSMRRRLSDHISHAFSVWFSSKKQD